MNTDKSIDGQVVKASEFKAKCLKFMDQVANTGNELVISKNGRPLVRLTPYQNKPASLFGINRGKIKILGDIIEPLDIKWEANLLPPGDTEA